MGWVQTLYFPAWEIAFSSLKWLCDDGTEESSGGNGANTLISYKHDILTLSKAFADARKGEL